MLTMTGHAKKWLLTALTATLTASMVGLAPTTHAQEKSRYKASKALPEKCDNRTVKILHRAGFRGEALRGAYAITWRESRHTSADESSRYYSGALGWWQVQTSVWSGQRWWSRSKMLQPYRQSRVVYRHMTDQGRNFAMWGLRLSSGGWSVDTTYYRSWSASQVYSHIWHPFTRGLALFPAECR